MHSLQFYLRLWKRVFYSLESNYELRISDMLHLNNIVYVAVCYSQNRHILVSTLTNEIHIENIESKVVRTCLCGFMVVILK